MNYRAVLSGLGRREVTASARYLIQNIKHRSFCLSHNLVSCLCCNCHSSHAHKWGYNFKVITCEMLGNLSNGHQFRCSSSLPDRNKHLVKRYNMSLPPVNSKSSLPNTLCLKGSQILGSKVPVQLPRLSEKLVNKCPAPVQPYLKLIRADRPIGKATI